MSVLWEGQQENKFEKVSSDGHQMSLARGLRPGGPMSDVQRGAGLGPGAHTVMSNAS